MNHRKPNQISVGGPMPPYCPPQPITSARANPSAAASPTQIRFMPEHGFVEKYITAYDCQSSAAATTAATQSPIGTATEAATIPSSATDKFATNTAQAVTKIVHRAKKTKTPKPKYKRRTKKYNNFNIFFMLERQLLLQSRGGGINAIETPIDISESPLVKYTPLKLPPLCHRYSQLPLTGNWFLELLANKNNKKRQHRKTHGLIPFKELAQTVAKHYREIDDETQCFVNEVAERLGWHCEELEAAHGRELLEPSFDPREYAIKKKKDAPVVSVAGRAAGPVASQPQPPLSQDEAATVHQLVGMNSHSLPQGHLKSAQLQYELSEAMKSRVESERRIHLLKRQMDVHQASTWMARPPPAPNYHPVAGLRRGQTAQHHHDVPQAMLSPNTLRDFSTGHEQYLAMLASAPHQARQPALPFRYDARQSSPEVPVDSYHCNPSQRRFYHPNVDSPGDVKGKLVRDELLRRLTPNAASGTGQGASHLSAETSEAFMKVLGSFPSAGEAGRRPIKTSQYHPLQDCTLAMAAPLKKRVRYSENVEDELMNERKRVEDGAHREPTSYGAENKTTLAICKELYSRLAASSSAKDTDATRDHQLLDTAASTIPHQHLAVMDSLLARSITMESAKMHHILTSSLARGSYPPCDAHNRYSQDHLSLGHHKRYAAAVAGMQGNALLPEVAATQRPKAERNAAHHMKHSSCQPDASPLL